MIIFFEKSGNTTAFQDDRSKFYEYLKDKRSNITNAIKNTFRVNNSPTDIEQQPSQEQNVGGKHKTKRHRIRKQNTKKRNTKKRNTKKRNH